MAYGKNKKIRYNFNPGKDSNYSKWQLNEGPNDVRMTVQQYLSRYKYQVQFTICPGHEEKIKIPCHLFKPDILTVEFQGIYQKRFSG